MSDSDNNTLAYLADLILKKNQADEEFDNMLKLNLNVSNSKENYNHAWSKAYDIVDAKKSDRIKNKYIKDFVAGRIRILKNTYDKSY